MAKNKEFTPCNVKDQEKFVAGFCQAVYFY